MLADGVLWDMDGTLIDTMGVHYLAWQEVLKPLGVPLNMDRFHECYGKDNSVIPQILLGDRLNKKEAAEIGLRKEELFRSLVGNRIQPMPGAKDWLERLRDEGVLQAVATGAPPENIDLLLNGAGIRPYFDAVVSSNGMPSKPDPAVFLEAARRIGVQPQRCVVVEDSIAGLLAAQAGGMFAIAVATSHPAEELQFADRVVNSLADLSADAFEI